MIISLRLKNFYSLRDYAALDFTAALSSRKSAEHLPENFIEFSGDKFVNIIGLFGSNAAGKSNMIKAIDFCRNLILNSHKNNEGDKLDFAPFKFGEKEPSEFYIDFVTEGVEYEYSFSIQDDKIISEELYHYPNKRRALIFSRNSNGYVHKKLIKRPGEVEAYTGSKTLFLSRASSMNRPIAQQVYRFFLNEMSIGSGTFDISQLKHSEFDEYKSLLLKAFEVSDSDIIDIRLIEILPGQQMLQSFHKENPEIPFDFEKEESEGTKRLLVLLLLILKKIKNKAAIFLDEFDLKLHLYLSEFILDVIRASRGSQLVFTSHNTSLINQNKIRSEQVVIVNKDSEGNSEFKPLSDFEGITKNTDLQKGYLQGRFDGIPYTGDCSILTELIEKNATTEEIQ